MAAKKARKQTGKRRPTARSAPATTKPARRPRGRPTLRSAEVEAEILSWIGDGKTLREFCRQPGKPSFVAVYEWLKGDESFSERFARAREIGADHIAEEILHIADTPKRGQVVTEDEDGKKVVTEDMLGHRRLQVDARLKLLAKWFPKKYGDKLDVEHSGSMTLEQLVLASRQPPAEK